MLNLSFQFSECNDEHGYAPSFSQRPTHSRSQNLHSTLLRLFPNDEQRNQKYLNFSTLVVQRKITGLIFSSFLSEMWQPNVKESSRFVKRRRYPADSYIQQEEIDCPWQKGNKNGSFPSVFFYVGFLVCLFQFSLPTPKGGKYACNPILVEDQREAQQRATRLGRTKTNALDPDYVAGNSPFAINDVYSRAAQLGRTGRTSNNFRNRRNPVEFRKKKR